MQRVRAPLPLFVCILAPHSAHAYLTEVGETSTDAGQWAALALIAVIGLAIGFRVLAFGFGLMVGVVLAGFLALATISFTIQGKLELAALCGAATAVLWIAFRRWTRDDPVAGAPAPQGTETRVSVKTPLPTADSGQPAASHERFEFPDKLRAVLDDLDARSELDDPRPGGDTGNVTKKL